MPNHPPTCMYTYTHTLTRAHTHTHTNKQRHPAGSLVQSVFVLEYQALPVYMVIHPASPRLPPDRHARRNQTPLCNPYRYDNSDEEQGWSPPPLYSHPQPTIPCFPSPAAEPLTEPENEGEVGFNEGDTIIGWKGR